MLPRTGQAIKKGIDLGWHPGAQICVWLDGDTKASAGAGFAAGTTEMTGDSVNPLLERRGLGLIEPTD